MKKLLAIAMVPYLLAIALISCGPTGCIPGLTPAKAVSVVVDCGLPAIQPALTAVGPKVALAFASPDWMTKIGAIVGALIDGYEATEQIVACAAGIVAASPPKFAMRAQGMETEDEHTRASQWLHERGYVPTNLIVAKRPDPGR